MTEENESLDPATTKHRLRELDRSLKYPHGPLSRTKTLAIVTHVLIAHTSRPDDHDPAFWAQVLSTKNINSLTIRGETRRIIAYHLQALKWGMRTWKEINTSTIGAVHNNNLKRILSEHLR